MFRQVLEETGMSVKKEFEMVALARKMDLFSIVYVAAPEEAKAMAQAGADAIIAHVGTTVGGSIGVKGAAVTMDEAVRRVQAIVDRARQVRKDILFLSHGGPIATPEDAAWINQHTDAVGFVGASSLERLAVEESLTNAIHHGHEKIVQLTQGFGRSALARAFPGEDVHTCLSGLVRAARVTRPRRAVYVLGGLAEVDPPARGVKSVNPRVCTSEKNNSVTDDGGSPHLSSRRRFPQLASGMPIKCIHFAVIASEQDSIFGKRRRGMNLTRRLKFPF